MEKKKSIFSYYKPYKKIFFADMFFAIMASIITLVIPLVVRYITSTVIYYETDEAFRVILKLGLMMTVLILFQCYCNYFIANYGHVMGAKIEYDMRAEIFAHYQKLPFSFYDNQKVGQLLSRITSDLFDITELLHHGPENVVISAMKFIGAFVILFTISPKLTFAAFALIPFMFLYAWFFNRKMKKAFARNRVKIADINAQIEDNLSGIRVVKSFANESVEEEKFKVGNDGFLAAKKDSYLYMGGYHSGLTAFINMITVIVLVAGGILITKAQVSVTDLVTFLLYISIMTDPVRTMIDFAEMFQNGYSGYERFQEILAIEPDIQDSQGSEELTDVKGTIDFENVSFQYEENTEKVLSHIDLHVDAGEYLALVGSSGAGKTTLCNLIPRFYDVTGGSIKVDGKDVRDLTLKSLRDHIGIVQQDVYLFVGTVYDNIAYGRPDATREEVIEAAKNANAHEFIMALPDGYDTDIGQRGVKLSGGQKQRLSIARAIAKKPRIYLFDDSFSALDYKTDVALRRALKAQTDNATVIIVAQRISTVLHANRILVLDEGRIVGDGTHAQLMESCPEYQEIARSQLSQKELNLSKEGE